MRTTLKTLTVTFVAAAGLLMVGAAPSTAGTGGGNDGGGVPEQNATAYLTGLTNKLDAMLDEFPNAGVGRPGGRS
jgi:hypothetical protein